MDANILREYLISLGVQINEDQAKKLTQSLAGWDKQAMALSTKLYGVAAAATAAVGVFAYQMEKLYFASKLADSSASNLQALDQGAARIGVKGFAQTVESIARSLRGNPGLQGLINSFGIPVKGRDVSDVAKDLMDYLSALSKVDYPRAKAYGSLFGISEDDIYLWSKNREEMQHAMVEQQRMAERMGVNVDRAAEAGHEVANAWRDVTSAALLFVEGIADKALPTVKSLKEGMIDWMAQMLRGVDNLKLAFADGDAWMSIQNENVRQVAHWLHVILETWKELNNTKSNNALFPDPAQAPRTPEGKLSGKEWREEIDPDTGERRIIKRRWLDKKYAEFMRWAGAKDYQGEPPDIEPPKPKVPSNWVPNERGGYTYKPDNARPANNASMAEKQAYLAKLEQKFNLPAGLLDRTWAQESNRGDPKWMRSAAGAEGDFGFMPATAKEYGLKDPYDFYQSADAAARKYADLQAKYRDPRLMAGAYNGGDRMIDNYLRQRRLGGEGYLAPETRGYMNKVGGPSINQTNNITVNGSSDPDRASREVAEQQRQVNADLIRNHLTRVY